MKRKLILGITATCALAALAFTELSTAADKPTTPPPKEDAGPGGPGGHKGPDGGPGCKWRAGGEHRGGPEAFGRGGDRRGRGGWGEDLNLTADQKAKVKAVMEANRPKIEAIRQEEQAKIKAVMDDTQSQIRPILTPAQQQVVDDMAKLRDSREKLRADAAATKKE